MPLMRTWIHHRFTGCYPYPNLINSWVVGSLDSAWRAVHQYLTLHRPDLWDKFRLQWGATEYWDENSNEDLVKSYRDLMERHLTIVLQKNGIEPKPE